MSEHAEPAVDTETGVGTEQERCLYRYPAYCRHHSFPDPFCNSRHPSKGNVCRRMAGHDGDHSAFIYSIAVPETWPLPPVPPVDLDDSDEEAQS